MDLNFNNITLKINVFSWFLDEIYQNLSTVHRTLSKLQSSFDIFLGSRRVVVASVASFLQDCVDIPLFFL